MKEAPADGTRRGDGDGDDTWLGRALGASWRGLSADTRAHLGRVYANLAAASGMAALGASMALRGSLPAGLGGPAVISVLSSLILLFYVLRPAAPMRFLRHGALYATGFSQGWLALPLLRAAVDVDPGLLVSGGVGALVVFASFSAAALAAPRRSYLYLGGVLMSLVLLMALGSLGNLFFHSTMFASAELYVGLAVFSLFVVYDTQVVVERAEQSLALGQRPDDVQHALMLFRDLAGVFLRLLLVLVRNRQEAERRARSQSRRRRR